MGDLGFDTEIWIFRDISSVTVRMVFVVENSRPEGLETLLWMNFLGGLLITYVSE